jgi:hypothetical protein
MYLIQSSLDLMSIKQSGWMTKAIAYYFAIQGSSLGENFHVVNGVC